MQDVGEDPCISPEFGVLPGQFILTIKTDNTCTSSVLGGHKLSGGITWLRGFPTIVSTETSETTSFCFSTILHRTGKCCQY